MMRDKVDQASLNPLIAQARSGALAQGAALFRNGYQAMFYQPRNSPSRSQVNEAYTQPLQVFYATNTWNTLQAQEATSDNARQPSIKRASPFGLPIPTRMPWDI